MRPLLLLTLLLAAPLAAQPSSDLLAVHTDRAEPSDASAFIGTYVGDEATLHVSRSGQSLVLALAGQSALDVLSEVATDHSFNAPAEALLRDAFAGSSERLAAALPARYRETGTQGLARMLTDLAAERGGVTSVTALGTVATSEDRTATLVRVRFADGEELLKLTWRDGRLATITRGTLPHVTAYPVRGSERRFAVLDAVGAPRALLRFDDGRLDVRGLGHSLTAERTH